MRRALANLKVLLTVLLILGARIPVWAENDDPRLRDRFVNGVIQASDKLDRISFRAKCTINVQNTSVSEKIRESYRKRNADPFKAKISESEIALRGPFSLHRLKSKLGLDTFKVRNDSYAFVISRAPEGRSTTIQFLEQLGISPKTDSQLAINEKEVRSTALPGFYLWGDSIGKVVRSKEFRIKRVYATPVDERELVRVEFDLVVNDQQAQPQFKMENSFLVSDPAQEWALMEYGGLHHNYINNATNESHVTFEYGESIMGIPIATKSEQSITSVNDSGNKMQITHLIEIVSQEQVSQDEYFLSHYGLPEPNFSRRGYSSWVWYLVCGAILIGVGVIVMKRRNPQD